MPLQPPGARARSGPFALDSACGAVALASTSAATTTPQPTGSISGSWPSALSLGAPSATKNRPGPRGRQVACGPCPRCLVSSAVRLFRCLACRVSQPPGMQDARQIGETLPPDTTHTLPVIHRGGAGCYPGLGLGDLGRVCL